MKYAELLQSAEPLETVKQIRESGTLEAARRDVETFVISDRMAGQLADVIFPNLRYDLPGEQKGILTVATYGTGKTHLMSVVAGVAEHAELASVLAHEAVRDAAAAVAGKFKVIRFDIGATQLPLVDIVATEVTNGLERMGVHHTFPDWKTVTNTRDGLVDMMASFEAVHPDHGLLFVLDELLDYLRTRKDSELFQDLAFLREIGEVCKTTRFRFISGVQEAIFDNPRFKSASEIIRKVRDRFEQVRIARDDVAFVVEQRLLKKDATQRELITKHLQQFSSLYDGMAERMDRFVALFPVHPDYLRTFEQITILEKREVLRTIEREVAAIRDTELPPDQPGLICSDTYRARLADDPSARTIPDVQTVLDKSDVLRNKVAAALPEKHYVETALRIVDALTVHRLTTDDIHRPIGMTADMLRDELCLLPPNLPERDALFLKTTVESIVRKILTAVSGQFLTIDPDNGQVYLDVAKDIDYDQQLDQRAESLDDAELDEGYYRAMEEVLGRREEPYVAGYRIWQYELPWAATNADRRGYLFMGAPNERSTAQPPRDFYVYFIQPYDPPEYTDEERDDEVFVHLGDKAPEFTRALRRYAAATTMAKESTASHRPVYEDKARRSLQDMVQWLRTNMGKAMTITHAGTAKPLEAWLATVPGERSRVQDQLDSVAASALSEHFGRRYPGYPRFSKRMTPSTLEADVRVALTQIATRRPTTAGSAILDAFELVGVGGAELKPDGRYATDLVGALDAAAGKVVNRSDLLEPLDPGGIPAWGEWHLEAPWLIVVAAALCQLGKLEISVDGRKIDALGLDHLTRLTPDQLAGFDHLAPPRSLPVNQLREVAALLDIAPGAVPDTGATEVLVREILTRSADILRRTDAAIREVTDGAELWGIHLFDLANERAGRLDRFRDLLLDLRGRDSVGKMNSLPVDPERVAKAAEGKAELERVQSLLDVRDKLSGVVGYLREASGVFGLGVDEVADAQALRSELELVLDADAVDAALVVKLRAAGEDLRRRFVELASRSYRHDNLDATNDARKRVLLEGSTMAALAAVHTVAILSDAPLAELRADLDDITTLFDVDERALADSVRLSGRDDPRPLDDRLSAAARLDDAERRAIELLNGWTSALLDSLGEPEMIEQIGFLDGPGRVAVDEFVSSRTLPDPVTPLLVAALNQVFERVEVRNLLISEIGASLFPDNGPATAQQLHDRLELLLAKLIGTADADRVRFLRAEEGS